MKKINKILILSVNIISIAIFSMEPARQSPPKASESFVAMVDKFKVQEPINSFLAHLPAKLLEELRAFSTDQFYRLLPPELHKRTDSYLKGQILNQLSIDDKLDLLKYIMSLKVRERLSNAAYIIGTLMQCSDFADIVCSPEALEKVEDLFRNHSQFELERTMHHNSRAQVIDDKIDQCIRNLIITFRICFEHPVTNTHTIKINENGSNEWESKFEFYQKALVNDNLVMLKNLLNRGALVDTMDRSRSAPIRPLHYAIAVQCSLATIKVLVERGAQVNTLNGFGNTALIVAKESGSKPEIIAYLQSKGAE